jgi:hypothetical protein
MKLPDLLVSMAAVGCSFISATARVTDDAVYCLIAAGGHTHRREEDSALQAGEPRYVRVGDQGPASSSEDM